MAEQDDIRLDKWLWAARFYKTRSLATAAVRGGHVHVDGARAKPSRSLCVGERLEITRGDARFELMVRALSANRGPASVAQALYEQTEASLRERDARIERRSAERLAPVPSPDSRPDKKQRRKLRRLHGRSD